MRKVFKYEFDPYGSWEIEMPIEAKILTCQLQHDKPVLWALVDPRLPTAQRRFMVVATGQGIPPVFDIEYIATVQMANGDYVFHLFEQK